MRTRGRLAPIVAQFAHRVRDCQGIALLEFEPAVDDGGEAVAGHAALGGARGPVEFGGDFGDEYLSVDRQVEALVGLFARLLPAPIVIDQVPERDVVATFRQEKTARTQGIAYRESEGDFPDAAVEFSACDQMGAPITQHEAVRIIGRQHPPCAGIHGALDLDGLEQSLAAGGGLEWQGKEGRQVLSQRAVAREHGIEVTTHFQPLIRPARDGGLHQSWRTQRIAESVECLRALGRDQFIDGAEHAVQSVAGATAKTLALFFDRTARPPIHANEELIVHLNNLIDQRLAGFHQIAGNERVALRFGEAAQIAGIVTASELAELANDLRIEVVQTGAGVEELFDETQTNDVPLYHSGVGRFWKLFEPEKA